MATRTLPAFIAAVLLSVSTAQAAPFPARAVDASGLRLWSFPSESPRFSLVVLVEVGSRHEERGRTGLAHVLEHCLFRGTAKRSAREVQAALSDLGTASNAVTTHDLTAYHFDVPATRADELVALVAEMLLEPAFDARDVASEVSIALEELGAGPQDLPSPTLASELYPGHALGRDIGGSPADVAGLAAADLSDFYRRHYRAGATVVAFAGAPDGDALRETLTRLFSALPPGRAERPPPAPAGATGVHVLPGAALAAGGGGTVVVGHHVARRDGGALAALLVLEGIVADETFQTVRTDAGLAYAPRVQLVTHPDTWWLQLGAHVADSRRLPRLVEAFDAAIATAGQADAARVERARTTVVDGLRVSDGRSLLDAVRTTWLLEAAGEREPDTLALLARVDARTVQAVATRELTPASRFIVSDDDILGEPPWMVIAFLVVTAVLVWSGWWLRPRLLHRWRRRRSRRDRLDLAPEDLRAIEADLERFQRGKRKRE